MTVKWGPGEVTVQHAIGDTGCERERWRFAFDRGVLRLRGYLRETLPTRRHRKWQLIEWWSTAPSAKPSLTKEQVPMSNALAAEILSTVALTMEIDHNGLSLPSFGYRLAGEDATGSGDAASSTQDVAGG